MAQMRIAEVNSSFVIASKANFSGDRKTLARPIPHYSIYFFFNRFCGIWCLMPQLTRLFMILAVAVFAASPVMACCVTGPAEASVANDQSEAPSCHDDADNMASAPAADDNTADCPGCADCETAMLQAKTVDLPTILASAADLHLVAVSVDQWSGFDAPRILHTTGPPRASPRSPNTPTSLKQRFLI